MSATDVDGAKNRLDEAKKLLGGIIDQMDSGMTAMIVTFADTPQVVQEFTSNRRLLRERLKTFSRRFGNRFERRFGTRRRPRKPKPDAHPGG